MVDNKLNGEQKEAVTATERNVAVTAGAGAGKTGVLVNRYVGLLESGQCGVENIVAITFTKKAANEMKERILKMVARAIVEGAADKSKWESVKDRLSAAYIGTIHSFCSRLLRENPVEALVDPRFSTLEDVESRILLNRSARAAVLHALDSGVGNVEDLVSEMGLSQVISAARDAYTQIRSAGQSMEEAEELSWRMLCNAASRLEPLVGQLEEELDALFDLERQRGERYAQLDPIRDACPATVKALASLCRAACDRTFEDIHAMSGIAEDLKAIGNSLNRVKRAYEDAAKSVKTLAAEVSERARDLVIMAIEVRAFGGFFAILRELDRRYAEEKSLRFALDYEDLQLKARDLLKNHKSVLEFYRNKFKHIMVDEFQDTNGLQEEIIRLLCGEHFDAGPVLFVVGDPKQSIYKFRGAEVSTFKRVQDDILSSGGKDITLTKNFRTASPIMDVVNAFFERLMQPADLGEKAEGLVNRLSPGGASQLVEFQRVSYKSIIPERCKADYPPRVELLVAPRDQSGVRGPVALEADALARRIRELVEGKAEIVYEKHTEGGQAVEEPRPVKYGDFAILFAAGTRVKEYERALYEAGVPYYTVSGRGFWDSREVLDVLTLLRCVNSEADLISLAGSLRSPFFGVSDETLLKLAIDKGDLATGFMEFESVKGLLQDEKEKLWVARQVIREARSLRSRLSAHELIDLLFERTGYEAYVLTRFMGTRGLANLRKLVRVAESFFGAPEILTLGDFLEYVDRLQDAEAREAEASVETEAGNTVKLMTIHSAKGLEFPVVAVADLGSKLNIRPRSVIFDRDLGVGLKVELEGGKRVKSPLVKGALDELDKWRETEEYKRLLYVAMTRARDYLILSGTVAPPKKPGKGSGERGLTFLKWILEGFGVPTAEDVMAKSGEVIELVSTQNGTKGRVKIIAAGQAGTEGQASRERRRLVDEIAIDTTHSEAPPTTRKVDLRRIEANIASVRSGLRRYGAHWVSEFLSYQKCPRLYHYQYRQRIPPFNDLGSRSKMFEELDEDAFFEAAEEIGIVEPSTDTVLDPIRKGDVVHAVCAGLTQPEELDGLLSAALRVYGLDGERLETAKSEVRRCLDNYIKSEVFARVSGATNLSEYPFSLLVPGGAVVTGIVDRVVIDGDGTAWVVDFKTNDVTSDHIRDTAEFYALQVRLYSEAVRRVCGLKVARASLFFLEPNVVYEISVSDDKLKEALELAGRMCFEMDAYDGVTPEATRGTHCGYCGYSLLCGDATQKP